MPILVRVRDLSRQPQPSHVVLHCSECQNDYSAHQGDYFSAAPDTVLRCCGVPLALVRRAVRYEPVAVRDNKSAAAGKD